MMTMVIMMKMMVMEAMMRLWMIIFTIIKFKTLYFLPEHRAVVFSLTLKNKDYRLIRTSLRWTVQRRLSKKVDFHTISRQQFNVYPSSCFSTKSHGIADSRIVQTVPKLSFAPQKSSHRGLQPILCYDVLRHLPRNMAYFIDSVYIVILFQSK